MKLTPTRNLTESQVRSGLKLVTIDGLAAEAMVAFTGGTFLVAMALQLGASNFQLGLLAALPTFCNIFQLFSVWLVQRYNNRRAVTVISCVLGRFPLLIIGLLPFLFSATTSIHVLSFLLFFHYLFGSVAGASWNSWMKDLIPEHRLGSFFSHRGRLSQIVSITLSILIALLLDYIRLHHAGHLVTAYFIMFICGGLLGLSSAYILSRTPEPESFMQKDNLLKTFQKPLKDKNFRNLLVFNSAWAFALNLATPFFAVYMLKTIGLPLSYIIGLGILNQLSSVFSIKLWGRYSDRYSNKTIIHICAPVYILCIVLWAYTAMPPTWLLSLAMLAGIHIFSGISTAGINLAISNMGIKLADKSESMIYLSAKNMIVAFVSALAPVIGGLMADFFATHQFNWNIEWKSEGGNTILHLINLQGWNFFFIIGGILALLSLRLLNQVKEKGEVNKVRVVNVMQIKIRIKVLANLQEIYNLSHIRFGQLSFLQKK